MNLHRDVGSGKAELLTASPYYTQNEALGTALTILTVMPACGPRLSLPSYDNVDSLLRPAIIFFYNRN